MEFEKVLNGVVKYVDRNLYKNMDDWQTFLARVFVSRMINQADLLKNSLIQNPFVRTFDILNVDGTIKIESLLNDIKLQMQRQEKLEIEIPLFGKFTFTPNDVDELYKVIMEDSL